MFILLSDVDDTMVLDTVRGHSATYARLRTFLDSSEPSIELPAASNCPACPDSQTLRCFRMVKSAGLILTEESPDGALQVSGRPDLLSRYIETFKFDLPVDGGHHHPEQHFWNELDPRSDMIFVEAEDMLDDPDAWCAPGEK